MFAQRLRLARKRAGLSMRALAECATPTVSAQAIGKYEAGKMLPSSAVLVGLGKALDVSLDFLMSGQIEGLDGLEFRKHAGVSAHDRAKAEAVLIDHLERHLAIEHVLDEHVALDWSEARRCDNVGAVEQIDEAADELREAWHLGMDPIPSLCELLEDKGIKVVMDDLPDSINGLTCHVLQGGKRIGDAVAVSAGVSVERKRFTLAHELGHRIIRSSGNPAINLESAVNRFASAFLIPRRRLIDAVGSSRQRVTYCEIMRLKKTYGVSAAAMLSRLGQVRVLSPGAVRNAFATFARSWRDIDPEPIEPQQGFAAFEQPRRFERLVWRAVGEELISPARAASLLNQPLADVERQISGPLVQ